MSRDKARKVGKRNTESSEYGDRMRHDRGLCILGELELLVGAFAHEAEEVLAERLVDLVEHILCGSARLGQSCAHADVLAPLPRENECAHRLPCSDMNSA